MQVHSTDVEGVHVCIECTTTLFTLHALRMGFTDPANNQRKQITSNLHSSVQQLVSISSAKSHPPTNDHCVSSNSLGSDFCTQFLSHASVIAGLLHNTDYCCNNFYQRMTNGRPVYIHLCMPSTFNCKLCNGNRHGVQDHKS